MKGFSNKHLAVAPVFRYTNDVCFLKVWSRQILIVWKGPVEEITDILIAGAHIHKKDSGLISNLPDKAVAIHVSPFKSEKDSMHHFKFANSFAFDLC